VNLTIERTIPDEVAGAFYAMYTAAFGPMRTRAAARHLLSEAEFAEEMADKRIEKYVVWADDGEPLALTTFTADVTAVAWVSPDFYAARYPEHTARGALFYLGYSLVRPDRPAYRAARLMLDRIVDRLIAERAVCVFDVAMYNDKRAVGRFAAALRRGRGARLETLDVQTYYGVTFGDTLGGPAGPDSAAAAGDTDAERDTIRGTTRCTVASTEASNSPAVPAIPIAPPA
jgi:hypothetical protein